MTLREKIGQCLLVYQWDIYRKCEIDYDIPRSKEERLALLNKEQFGVFYGEQVGVYYAEAAAENRTVDLAEQNSGKIKSLNYKEFIDNQSKLMKIPALTAADCERGAGSIFADLTNTCDAPCMGAANSEELAFELGAAIGREFRCGGLNWRWFPVADLPHWRSGSIMRTIAADFPDRLAKLANAHIKGMQSEGVAATIKHFPGADRLDARDSHFCKTLISVSMEEWEKTQGKIFQEIIDGGVYSVMVGHQAFPAADETMINDSYIPATLSKKIITDLLKDKMGFDGVVITDAITMGGLFSLLDYENLIIGLINAGNDVILGAKIESGDILEKAVLDGRIPESRIDDACRRILDMKEKLGMFKDDYFNLPYKAEDIVGKTIEINSELARRSITLVRDRHNLLPLDKNKIKRVSIICSSHDDDYINDLDVLKKEFEARGASVFMQRRLKTPEELKKISEESDLIIYAVYIAPHKPRGGMALFGDECFTYFHAFSSGNEKSIGVSMGYPYVHYNIMENANTFINTYGKSPDCMKAFTQAIFGEIEITGESPVNLIPNNTGN